LIAGIGVGGAAILSKMTWESLMSQFMPLQGPCFSVIVIAWFSTSKYHKNTPDPFDRVETPGIVSPFSFGRVIGSNQRFGADPAIKHDW
jgi:hypothetical protein